MIKFKVKSSKFKIGELWFKGVAIVGMKDERRGGKKIEVHVLDFDKNIYGWYGEAELVKKLRSLKKFRSEKLLIAQIKKDIAMAKKTLR